MEHSLLIEEAATWRLLGLLFERPREGWHAELSALAAEMHDGRFGQAERAARDADEGGYLSVLGPGRSVSPREVAYRPMGDPGKILAELQGIYDAFGYAPRTEDPPDHIAVEAGFVGFMKLKLAYAAAQDEAGARQTTEAAVESFLRDHLAGFAGELARRLQDSPLEHLGLAAAILKDRSPSAPLPLVRGLPETDELTTCGETCGH